ncbi:MAG TPA: DUF92 domain-containing protein [Gemmatimonadales bacterium]|jgi:uncharacterized protein (TIGR00297 family)
MTPALALGISLAVALVAWRARAVSGSGAVAATAVGTAVLWTTGWAGAAVLGMFFLPSTVVGRLGARRPAASDARGEQRDAVQVLANGGPAALGACGELLVPGLGFWALTGALAAASADTWATSLGAFSRRDPRHLLEGRRVPRGTSGGVSLVGSLGGVLGAVAVAGTAAAATGDRRLLSAGFALGAAGMLLDSLLGAWGQARFRCPACDLPSERRIHRCGTRTQLVGGWRWLDNDGVNAVATAAAGLAGALWFRLSG